MKQAFNDFYHDCGMDKFKWYHYIIVMWWTLSLVTITGECDSMLYYIAAIFNFVVATATMLGKLPVKDIEE